MEPLDWPFRAAEALDAGALTYRELRRFHAATYPGAWDIERIAILESLGWVVIRVSAHMLRNPGRVIDRVGATLIGRGCPKSW
jgi:hypothetical protein